MYSRCLSILYLLLANPNELNNEDEEKKLPQGTEEHPKLTKPQIRLSLGGLRPQRLQLHATISITVDVLFCPV